MSAWATGMNLLDFGRAVKLIRLFLFRKRFAKVVRGFQEGKNDFFEKLNLKGKKDLLQPEGFAAGGFLKL